jgi:predicted DNA-binding helix-hairpin-helix protein
VQLKKMIFNHSGSHIKILILSVCITRFMYRFLRCQIASNRRSSAISSWKRFYQTDWLMRFYGFKANEILDKTIPFWISVDLNRQALRNITQFQWVFKMHRSKCLRVPGIESNQHIKLYMQEVSKKFNFRYKRKWLFAVEARYFISRLMKTHLKIFECT